MHIFKIKQMGLEWHAWKCYMYKDTMCVFFFLGFWRLSGIKTIRGLSAEQSSNRQMHPSEEAKFRELPGTIVGSAPATTSSVLLSALIWIFENHQKTAGKIVRAWKGKKKKHFKKAKVQWDPRTCLRRLATFKKSLFFFFTKPSTSVAVATEKGWFFF